MDLYSFLPLAIVVTSIWLLVLSTLLYWFVLRHQKNKKESVDQDLVKEIEQLRQNHKELAGKLRTVVSRLDQQESSSVRFLQKIGFARFNPFAETGGDQSFSIALLNGQDDGFVITSLHTRNGTRTYAKKVIGGKIGQGMSKEEQKVIQLAQNYESEKH